MKIIYNLPPHSLSYTSWIGSGTAGKKLQYGSHSMMCWVCWEQVLEPLDPYLLMKSPAVKGVGQVAERLSRSPC